jgi:uncharacterized protein YqfA (UPF0365 family)
MRIMNNQPFLIIAVVISTVVCLSLFFFFVIAARPWLRAFMHKTPVSILNIIAIRLRGNSPAMMIDAYIALRRIGMSVTLSDVENEYIDNGNRSATSEDLF